MSKICVFSKQSKTKHFFFIRHFSRYIIDKLLQQCEKLSDISVTSQRKILDNALFVVPFEKDGNLIQFRKTAESFVVSKQPLKAIENVSKAENSLPDIHPLRSNISIEKENIYQIKNIYRMCMNDHFNEINEYSNQWLFN